MGGRTGLGRARGAVSGHRVAGALQVVVISARGRRSRDRSARVSGRPRLAPVHRSRGARRRPLSASSASGSCTRSATCCASMPPGIPVRLRRHRRAPVRWARGRGAEAAGTSPAMPRSTTTCTPRGSSFPTGRSIQRQLGLPEGWTAEQYWDALDPGKRRNSAPREALAPSASTTAAVAATGRIARGTATGRG